MLGGDAVKPERRVPDAHFGMHDLAVRGTVDAARLEPERVDQKIMGSLDVAVHQSGITRSNATLIVPPCQAPRSGLQLLPADNSRLDATSSGALDGAFRRAS